MAILDFVREEHSYADLSKRRRLFLLILVSVGSSAIYTPIYLKSVFYDPLMQALGCTNEQLGTLVTVYAIAATVFYFFSGVVADKVRVRTLSWVGYAGTALLTFVYAMLPSYRVLLAVFFCYAIFSILIWWGTRFKLVRLIYPEEEYAQRIGVSYGIFGAAGLILGGHRHSHRCELRLGGSRDPYAAPGEFRHPGASCRPCLSRHSSFLQ